MTMSHHIRIATIKDSELIVRHYDIVGGETHYHTFGFGEYSESVEEQEMIIKDIIDMDNSLFIVTEVDDEIVAVLTFLGGKSSRTYHQGNLGITVQQRFWGNRIGTQMMNYLLDWCDDIKVIKKINSILHEDNSRAIKLYERFGFVEEGRSDMYFHHNNRFSSAIYMGLKITDI